MSFYRSYFRLNVNSHMWLVPTILDKTILDCCRNRVKGLHQALCCSTNLVKHDDSNASEPGKQWSEPSVMWTLEQTWWLMAASALSWSQGDTRVGSSKPKWEGWRLPRSPSWPSLIKEALCFQSSHRLRKPDLDLDVKTHVSLISVVRNTVHILEDRKVIQNNIFTKQK